MRTLKIRLQINGKLQADYKKALLNYNTERGKSQW